jgi:hypothetical protein
MERTILPRKVAPLTPIDRVREILSFSRRPIFEGLVMLITEEAEELLGEILGGIDGPVGEVIDLEVIDRPGVKIGRGFVAPLVSRRNPFRCRR